MQAYNKAYTFFSEVIMDFKALLPLLLAGNKNNEKIIPLINAMNTSNKEKPSPSDEKSTSPDNLFDKVADPAVANLIKSAMSGSGNKPRTFGIEQVVGIANDEILGKMVKYLENNFSHEKKVGKNR